MNFLIEFIVDGLFTGLAETVANTDKSKSTRLLGSIILLFLVALIISFFVFVVFTVAKKYLALAIVLAVFFALGIVRYIVSFIKVLRNKTKS